MALPEQLKDVTVPANRILVSPLTLGEVKTTSGLITSLATKEKQYLNGIVHLVGPGKLSTTDNQTRIPLYIQVGDIVRFDDTQVKKASINGETFYILPEGEESIIAVIGKIIDDKPEIYVDD